MVVTTWTTDPATIQSVRARGSGYVQPKGMEGYSENGPRMIEELLREMGPFLLRQSEGSWAPPGPVIDPEKDLRRRISNALGRISIPAGTIGHSYLLDAIITAIHREDGLVDMDNCIYPALVKIYHVDKRSIEVAMRRYIERAWSRVDMETLQREYTQYVDPQKGKPEVREFIGYYASRFR